MNAHTKRSRGRAPAAWIVALATLLIAPAAQADGWHRHGSSHHSWSVGWRSDAGVVFRFESLAGYGRWHRVAGVGGYVWFPYVDTTWRPYYYGHWVHTSLGMTWVSYEPWGDIPHHYGRWVWVDHLGWGWVPGYDYAPAWVTWGVVDGYVGWAPLAPDGFRYAHYHTYVPGRHHPDYRFGGGTFVYDSSGLDFSLWIFVSNRDFYGSSVHSCAVPVERTLSLFKSKEVLPVGRQLSVDYVRKVSPRKIETVAVDRRTKSIGGRESVYVQPRGQADKVRAGREDVKRSLPVTKTRSGEVRRPADAQDAPVRVWTKADGAAERREGARAAERSAPSKPAPVKRVTKTRETARDRRDVEPTPRDAGKSAVREERRPQPERASKAPAVKTATKRSAAKAPAEKPATKGAAKSSGATKSGKSAARGEAAGKAKTKAR
jgi:hypothetical protein